MEAHFFVSKELKELRQIEKHAHVFPTVQTHVFTNTCVYKGEKSKREKKRQDYLYQKDKKQDAGENNQEKHKETDRKQNPKESQSSK